MPKKTRVSPLNWDAAIAMFGKDAIRQEAQSPQTLSNWRNRGVPADVALPLLLAKYGGRALESAPGPVHDISPLYEIIPSYKQVDERLRKAVDDLTKIFLGADQQTRDLVLDHIEYFAGRVRGSAQQSGRRSREAGGGGSGGGN